MNNSYDGDIDNKSKWYFISTITGFNIQNIHIKTQGNLVRMLNYWAKLQTIWM